MKQLNLSIQFDSIEQLAEFCARFDTASNAPVPVFVYKAPPAGVVTPVEQATPAPVIAAVPKDKRKRRTKAEMQAARTENAAPAEVTNPSTPSTKDSKPAAAPEPTRDSVLEAFKKLHDAKGLTSCLDLLKRHGATRFGEVKPEQYLRFMQDVVDMLAGKDIAAAQSDAATAY